MVRFKILLKDTTLETIRILYCNPHNEIARTNHISGTLILFIPISVLKYVIKSKIELIIISGDGFGNVS